MSLIDATYFIGELNIANTDEAAGLAYLNIFIDKYESEYLKLLLGKTLYASFVAGLVPVPVDPPTDPATFEPIAQKWIDLQNQLLVISGTSKVSPIANFVYFYFIRRATYSNTGAGMTQPAYENATVIDSKIETSRAWNEMNKLSFEVYKFLKENVATYGPLPYDLRFLNNDYLYIWFDWSYWWGFFPFNYRRLIPEIFRPIIASGI